jgi:hypothetical protein
MRAWIEDVFAAACWLAAFAGVAVVMVGVGA